MATRKTTRKPRSAAQLANDAKLAARRPGSAASEAAALMGDVAPDPLAALMADPAMGAALAALVDAAVKARVAQGTSAPAATPTSEMGELAKTFGKMLEIQAMQMPGYFKPLPAEEVERRAAGQVEMFALLESYKRYGTPARYYVGAGKLYAGAVLWEEGMVIDTYLPPPEDFMPCYDAAPGENHKTAREAGERAANVLDAQMVWLGGPSPDIASRVSEAEAEAHSRAVPLVGNEEPAAKVSPVTPVNIAPRNVAAPPAFAGLGETIIPGMGAHPLPPQAPGSRSAPARGPAFVE